MTVRVERSGAVAVVVLDRPKVNAIDSAMVGALDEVCATIESDGGVRAAVLTGERTFSAGADLQEMAQGTPMDVMARIRRLQRLCDRIEALPVVTIAAVAGYALGGGCELALACDLRFAATRARFGQPEIAVGLIPGAGGTQRLPRLVGVSRAKQMIFGGQPVAAEQALAWGLCDEVVEAEQLRARAIDAASVYAEGPTHSLAAAKRVINRGMDGGVAAGLELELEAFTSLFSTRDTRHGLDSFLKDGPGKARFTGE